MVCQLEYSFIMFISSTRIMIVFEFSKIRRCLVQTKNAMIKFYMIEIANFLQQLGYIIFELILIIEKNLCFAWCEIWSLKFQFVQGVVWFFWIRTLWCFRIAKWSKGRCIQIGKGGKIDILRKMICWKYGHLWLATSKSAFFWICFKETIMRQWYYFFCCWKML